MNENINIVIRTDFGDIEAELYPKKAPVTVANFLANIASGLYEGGYFHRAASSEKVFKDEDREIGIDVIEAAKAEWKQNRSPIIHENDGETGLKNTYGALSMSRFDPGTATSGFFVNVSNNDALDFHAATESAEERAGYTVFGMVKKGMEVVHVIHERPTGNRVLSDDESVSNENVKKTDPELASWYLLQLLDVNVRIHGIDVT